MFDTKPVETKPKTMINEDGEEVPVEDHADGGEQPEGENQAKSSFRPEDYEWTMTNRIQKGLAELFRSMKKGKLINESIKSADAFSASQYEAISKSLDEFCDKMADGVVYTYQQVDFSE